MGEWLTDNANGMCGVTTVSILVLSLLPAGSPESEIGSSWIWNFGHVPAYALLAALGMLALAPRRPAGYRLRASVGVAIVTLAAILELVQPLVGRTASLIDVGSGALGALIGIGMHAVMAGRTPAGETKGGTGDGPR